MSSVPVHVVGTDPRGGESPDGKLPEHFLQLSSPSVFAEEIVRRYGNGDHPLRAGWVWFCGGLTENKIMSLTALVWREEPNPNLQLHHYTELLALYCLFVLKDDLL